MTPQQAVEQGFANHQAGRLAQAETFYAAALAQEPGFFPALHLMGMLRYHQGNLPEARGWLEKALAQRPGASETLLHYGLLLAVLGESDAALAALDRTIAALPAGHSAVALAEANRGEIFLGRGAPISALAAFDAALAVDAAIPAVWNNRGLALAELKRHDEALVCFDRVIALLPDSVQGHNNRGDALRALRRLDEALASFDRALALDPRDWATHNNRAIALTFMNRLDEALAAYDAALALRPDIPEALHARGNLLWTRKAQLAPALADLERLVRLAPDFPYAQGSLMRLEMVAARWDGFDARKARLDAGVRADKPVVEPFIYLALSGQPADILRCTRLYAQMRFPAQAPLWRGGQRKPGRIRIGYVCGEFRTHPTLYLMAGMFEAHDRSQFEIFAFDNGGGDGSGLRQRLEAAVDRLIDISAMSDHAAAAAIRSEEIDILVDLNGYSGNQRIGIFAWRPAGVQVTYLAYPGTLGVPYMDYLLADRIVIPEAEEDYYSEKIAWLPHSYQVNDDKRAIAEAPSRSQAGLPELPSGSAGNAFVFCNFNHANKFTPQSFALWMRLLAQVPGSVLWLLKPDPIPLENLRREAERHGMDPARLIFADHLPFEKHLARLARADLFVDGLPYGAHTTASDALWAGLPLVTCRGTSFAGRVAASLLTALDMPELIAESPAELEKLALALAREPQRLAQARAKLARNAKTAPLFDTQATTRAIERAYQQMLAQDAPRSFAVEV
jgi:predicted O-linked N-acetylglucosamine transferase (SPINDLY family)